MATRTLKSLFLHLNYAAIVIHLCLKLPLQTISYICHFLFHVEINKSDMISLDWNLLRAVFKFDHYHNDSLNIIRIHYRLHCIYTDVNKNASVTFDMSIFQI